MNSFLKFSIGIAVVLLIAAATLFILGSERGRHSTRLLIDAPPETVFSYLTDAAQVKKWVGGLVEIRPMGDLTNDVGARSVVTSTSNGRTVESDEEIIRYEEGELFSVQSTNEFRIQTSIFQLEAKDQQTQLTYRMLVANRGLGKILGVFDRTPVQDKMESDARRLKELIESQPLPPTIDDEVYSGTASAETVTASPDDNE